MIEWGQYAQAYRAIYEALQTIASPPIGKKIRGHDFEWYANGKLKNQRFYGGTKQSSELLFTLSFEWNEDGTLKSVWRTDA